MSERVPRKQETRAAQLQPRQLLARILEEPDLVAQVQALEPRTLGTLIQHIGLEDSGELISLATTAQLERIFDDDLWQSERPGQDESFRADRFAVWLEVMLEAGEDFVAQKLSELPEELVTLALQQHILVVNNDELTLGMVDEIVDVDLTEKALDSCLSLELGEYQLISKRHDGWDALVAVLLALDRDHHDLLQSLLARCCALSSEYIEDNGGLYEVLTSEQMLETDASADREDRRAREGFIAPSAAASFLSLACKSPVPDIVGSSARDPITNAYFRELVSSGATFALEEETKVARLVEMLRQAQVLQEGRAVALLEGGDPADPNAADRLFQRAIVELRHRDADVYAKRLEELAYLANVLVAGCSFHGRAFRPGEAAEAVVATCNLGLEHLRREAVDNSSSTSVPTQDADILARESADKLFRLGWHLVHQISLAAGAALLRLLVRPPDVGADHDDAAELARAEKALRSALAAGKPWTLRGKLDALDLGLDDTMRATLQALLDQCPTLPSVRDVDHPAGELATEFLSTKARLEAATDFLRGL